MAVPEESSEIMLQQTEAPEEWFLQIREELAHFYLIQVVREEMAMLPEITAAAVVAEKLHQQQAQVIREVRVLPTATEEQVAQEMQVAEMVAEVRIIMAFRIVSMEPPLVAVAAEEVMTMAIIQTEASGRSF